MDERRLHDELSSLERAAPAGSRPALPVRRRSPFLWLPASLALIAGVLIGVFGGHYVDSQRLVGNASPPAWTPIVSSSSPPSASTLTWRQSSFASSAIMRSLSVIDGRIFATGYGPEAWYSDDGGGSWARSELTVDDIGGASIATTQDLSLGPVIRFHDRLVSLGTRMAGTSGNDADVAGSIWFSDDRGATWTLSSGATPPVSTGIASNGRNLVAVGRPWQAGSAELWISSDGTAWNKVDAPDLPGVTIANIAAIDGTFMAVGTRENAFGDAPGAVTLTSDDGFHWETTVLAAPGRLSDVVVQGTGFTISGDIGSGDGRYGAALVTRGSDGVHIRQVAHHVGSISGPVAVGPLGAVIGTQDIGTRFGAQLWFLPDGSSEAAIPSDVSFVPSDVVALPDRFVALVSCPPTADCARSFEILVGASRPQPNATSASVPPRQPLPTLESDGGGCRDVGLDATLAGDPSDPRLAWLVNADGSRQEIVWPPGLTARFDPKLQVIDRSGAVVMRAGAHIDGGCTAGPADDPGSLILIRPGG